MTSRDLCCVQVNDDQRKPPFAIVPRVAALVLIALSICRAQGVGGDIASGQTTTLLPDGRLLLIGGQQSSIPVGTASIKDSTSGRALELANGLQTARALGNDAV